MGGDGGVIAVNRKFMRAAKFGASTATSGAAKENDRENRSYAMKNCKLSGCVLTDDNIVCCDYGWLYDKESVIEALLERMGKDTTSSNDADGDLGHIRSLKDIYPVCFTSGGVENPTCPVTGVSLNGVQPCFAIKRADGNGGCVISDRAVKVIIFRFLSAPLFFSF